jgi:4-oxalocrotonate tautomerase family enzyme
MPFAHVYLLEGHPQEDVKRLVAELSSLFAEVIAAPRERLRVWVSEVPSYARGPVQEETPIVQLHLLAGRPKEQHHALIAGMTDVVERVVGARRELIRICITEVAPDSFGIGGVPASIARKAEIAAREK